MPYSYHLDGTLPVAPDAVFVFGSNAPFGRHGKGAALVAKERFGARYGQGVGFAGSSYAIPTKTSVAQRGPLTVLPLDVVRGHVATFLDFARQHPELLFFVVRIGCYLAGYRDDQIAPLFRGAPTNCSFAKEWQPWLDQALPPEAAP
jgi:hypothetical protein